MVLVGCTFLDLVLLLKNLAEGGLMDSKLARGNPLTHLRDFVIGLKKCPLLLKRHINAGHFWW